MQGKTLAGAVALVAVVVLGLGMAVLYAGGPPPPPERPKPPPPPEAMMNSELRFSPIVYRGQIEEDARKLGVRGSSLAELAVPFLYVEEHAGRRTLKPRGSLDTPHLRIVLDVEKHEARLDEGHSFGFEHLVLRVENRTSHYLAYRIETDVPDRGKCASKGELPQNAIVLEPRQTLRRTECLYRRNARVDVLKVEVMELPPLSAHYVSRLPPTSVFYDPRTAGGHLPLKGELCPQTFSWREIQEGAERKEIGWRDVIDFYARHSCEEYSFFRGYRFRTSQDAPLPARPDR